MLDDACARVLRCAEGAAAATRHAARGDPGRGRVAADAPEPRARRRLPPPARAARAAREPPHAPTESIGSSDITHVSRVVPTIHPNFPIGARPEAPHARVRRRPTTRPGGEAGLLEAARALALTVLELARSPGGARRRSRARQRRLIRLRFRRPCRLRSELRRGWDGRRRPQRARRSPGRADWAVPRRRMAERLARAACAIARVLAAFAAVPRHLLVPEALAGAGLPRRGAADRRRADDLGARAWWRP